MGSPQYKNGGGRRTDRQVLWAGGYILALLATVLLLSKGGVINTTGVRLWLYSQPASPPPCTGSIGVDGGLQSRDCLGAAAEEQPQQGRLRRAAALHDGPLDIEVAGLGEEEEDAGDTAAEEATRQQLEAAAEATRLHQKQQRRELEREAAEAEEEAREEEEAAAAREEREEEEEEEEEEASEEEEEEEEEQQQQGVQEEYAGPSPYQEALASCDDLDCLTRAAAQERWPGQFLFPHFFIVGWQKCATTSLFWHLDRSPQILTADDKEPEFFSNECGYDPANCTAKASKKYIWKTMLLGDALEADLRVAAVEASTHYGRNGHILAPRLRQALPWLKIVVSLREPISRSISMLAHNLDKHEAGCLTKADTYNCLARDLGRENFSQPLQGWLQAYPTEQIYLIQYENLTSSAGQSEVLHGLKRYLGIDPELPDSDLGMRNTREYHLQRKGALEEGEQAEGWPMKRWQYEALVKQVRPDALRVAELATEYGLADGQQWMQNWEEEWRLTLEECDGNGDCIVFPN